MASGLRLREFLVLTLILLITQTLYCSASDDTDSTTTQSSGISGAIQEKLEDILPACVFDDHSVSLFLYSEDYPYGVHIDENNITEAANCQKDVCVSVSCTVHGFTSRGNASQFYEINQRCIKKPGYLCLGFDWSTPACTTNSSNSELLFYPSGVKNVKSVGEKLGMFLSSLISSGCCLSWIELTCHSLGAHVCGFAGKYVQKHTNIIIDKINGLEPAGPLFELDRPENRLAKTDAKYVSVLHTSAVGIQKCIGHTDTFVNGGALQPGCGVSPPCSHTFSLTLFRDCMDCTCFSTPYQNHQDNCPPSYFARTKSPSCCVDGTCSCAKIGFGPVYPYNVTGVFGMKTPKESPLCNGPTTDEQ